LLRLPPMCDFLYEDRSFLVWLSNISKARLLEQIHTGDLFFGGPLEDAKRWLVERGDDIPVEDKNFIERALQDEIRRREEIQAQERRRQEAELAEAKAREASALSRAKAAQEMAAASKRLARRTVVGFSILGFALAVLSNVSPNVEAPGKDPDPGRSPFLDIWLFLIGQTNDHINSGARYFLVALFFGLLGASIVIAWRNWYQDPTQRSLEHLTTWFIRAIMGCMWFQSSLWKLPLPVSGAFQYWTEQVTRYAAFSWHRWLAANVLLPFIEFINPVVFLTELSIGIALILGFMVRPMTIVGMLFVLHLWLGLYHQPNEWMWNYIFLFFVQCFFIINNAGKSLGLDALLSGRRRSKSRDEGPANDVMQPSRV